MAVLAFKLVVILMDFSVLAKLALSLQAALILQ